MIPDETCNTAPRRIGVRPVVTRTPLRVPALRMMGGSTSSLPYAILLRLRPTALDRSVRFGRPTGPPDLRLAIASGRFRG